MKTLNSFVKYIKKFPPGIFLVIMLIISILWGNLVYEWIWEGYYTVSVENFWENIIARSRNAPKEEFLWRFLPFTLVMLILSIKIPIGLKKIIILIMGIFVVFVQIQFGLSHICKDPIVRMLRDLPDIPSYYEKFSFVLYQGVLGIFYALVYFKILLHMKGRWRYIQIFPLLISTLIHIFNNQAMIVLGLYGY